MLEDIKKNVEKLIALYENERSEKERLSGELVQCKAKNEAYAKQISDLEREIDNLRLTEAFTAAPGSDSGAKEKIGKMMREIDRCISLLEQ